MSAHVILSCPFCHHKAEYRDAPPGSTVRCHDCACIFRVPALSRRRPGTVVTGEEIRGGAKKHFAFIVVLVVVAAVAGGVWWWMSRDKGDDPDPFAGMGFADEGTGVGTLQRFLEAWKRDDMDLLLRQCRANDRERRKLLDRYADPKPRLKSYTIRDNSWEIAGNTGVVRVTVDIVGEHPRTNIKANGTIKIELWDEKTLDGKEFWLVDLNSAMPEWQD